MALNSKCRWEGFIRTRLSTMSAIETNIVRDEHNHASFGSSEYCYWVNDMHSFLDVVAIFFSPLNASANALYAQFSKMACSQHGVFAIAAIVVASIALSVACAGWTLIAGRRASAQREDLKAALRQSHLAVRFRDTLIHSFPEAVVVLPTKNLPLLSYHGGKRLLQSCLAGPDARTFAAAIDALLMRGSTFSLTARTSATGAISVRGQLIGDHTIVFLSQNDAATGAITGATSHRISHTPCDAGTSKGETQEACPRGHDAAWQRLTSAGASDVPERYDAYGSLACSPGHPMAISPSRKPNRSTRTIREPAAPRMVA